MDYAGFNAPSKPGQYRVYGRDGHVTSGPGYNTMVSLIRTAAYDVRNGKDHHAATEIAKARSLLAASNFGRDWNMENPGLSRDLAVAASSPQADGALRHYSPLAYLGGCKGLLFVVVVLGIITFFAGWKWLGAAAMLPLLSILPCTAMMAMCMRGHDGSGNTLAAPNKNVGSGPAGGR
jgi:hypothetical protein